MAKYLVLGMGSPSDMNEFTREYESLDGMTPSDYAKSKGVKVLTRPATLSCHNTPNRPGLFAQDLESIAWKKDSKGMINKVIAVLGGGMSLQLPAIVASYTHTVPVIGVPFYSSSTFGGGLDALSACTNLPGGRAVMASAPIHFKDAPSIDNAVQMAIYMLVKSHESEFALVCDHKFEKESVSAIDALIDSGLRKTEFYVLESVDDMIENIGMALNITNNNDDMFACDSTHDLSVHTMLPKRLLSTSSNLHQFVEFALASTKTEKSLFVAKPANAAEFFARVIGLYDIRVRERIKDVSINKIAKNMLKYGTEYRCMTEDSFE